MFPPPHQWTMDTLCVVIEQKTISGWCRWLELSDGLLQCQASTHQNQFAYEIRSQSVKAFLSYSTETILGWYIWCPSLIPSILSLIPILIPILKSIGQSILELLHRNHFRVVLLGGAIWCSSLLPSILSVIPILKTILKTISQSILELLSGIQSTYQV